MSAERRLEHAMLAWLYDHGGTASVEELRKALCCLRRDLWGAIRNQCNLGNIRRGELITLTASARAAIAAGRRLSMDWRTAA